MSDIPLAEAKAHLSDLVERVMQGEIIQITKQGKPVVQIKAVDPVPVAIDITALRALTDAMPQQCEEEGSWLRKVRDEARY